ncbi:hypothetical protein [Streptomyces sp. SS8]
MSGTRTTPDDSRPTRLAERMSVVPYIAAWSGEPMVHPRPVRVALGGGRLGFPDGDATSYGHDWRGALWARQFPGPGKGRPQYETVHVQRQRRAMSDLLCQVCGTTTVTGAVGERFLFLVKDVGRPVLEGERTTSPPVCVPCAHIAVRECPYLARGHVAAWVRDAVPWGVAGIVHHPYFVRPLPSEGLVDVSYDAPALAWTLAHRQVVALYGCTPVNLVELTDPA